VHHLLGGEHREQRASLNLRQYLANDLKLSVVLVGTNDARVALQTDAPRWRENDELRRLLSVPPYRRRAQGRGLLRRVSTRRAVRTAPVAVG
jgi:hypothetical protein